MLTATVQNLSQGGGNYLQLPAWQLQILGIDFLDEATSSIDTRTERIVEEVWIN